MRKYPLGKTNRYMPFRPGAAEGTLRRIKCVVTGERVGRAGFPASSGILDATDAVTGTAVVK